jgi:hypothetical protein
VISSGGSFPGFFSRAILFDFQNDVGVPQPGHFEAVSGGKGLTPLIVIDFFENHVALGFELVLQCYYLCFVQRLLALQLALLALACLFAFD